MYVYLHTTKHMFNMTGNCQFSEVVPFYISNVKGPNISADLPILSIVSLFNFNHCREYTERFYCGFCFAFPC